MTAFDRYLHSVIERGALEAHEDRSAAIEAQHLLLAIAAGREPTTRQVLASAGLDRQAIRAALDLEFERSLNAAGVSLADFDLPRPSPAPKPPTQLGASARLALDRMATVFRKKDLRPAHLLLGILQAEAGTVPRALALAGVDQAGLVATVRRALPGQNG
ncbi:Clp protease N-terminal domain-containing protein [Nonomuraea lactucae]|uniref:Clp protease N-terminal domain-containing protein n=1 Tax=Nonomuraea lactucae TaxID=2249762 RepID=UPI000DE2C5ED|nr:Clp protease N-terminal domain-containing protein [Nonomuraea lactucae]